MCIQFTQILLYFFKILFNDIINVILCQILKTKIKIILLISKIPQNSEEWKIIEKDFSEKWNFCHCCGSMDNKNIVIQSSM